MGAGWQRLRGIPNDLQWVQPPGQHGVYSFAMALVSAQPRVYSLWGASQTASRRAPTSLIRTTM